MPTVINFEKEEIYYNYLTEFFIKKINKKKRNQK